MSASFEQRLLQKQKLEGVGTLAGGVAHNFNNALTVILGHCNLILEGMGSDNENRDSVESIKKAADRAAGIDDPPALKLLSAEVGYQHWKTRYRILRRTSMKIAIRLVFLFPFVLASNSLLAQMTPQTTLPFPQIAVGETQGYYYVTRIVLTNPSSSTATGSISFGDDAGRPLSVTVSSVLTGNTAKGSSINISTAWEVTSDGPITGGWAVVSTDISAGGNGVAIGGTAAYELFDPDDELISVAASGTQGFVRQFSTANIMRQPDLQTGVAILNYSNASNTVTLELFDSSATRIANVTRTLPAYGHMAAFTHEIFGLTLPSRTSISTLKVSSSALIASVVLLFEGAQVTAAPVITSSITTPTPVTQQPTISSITPTSGAAGSTVNLVIRGSGFGQFTSPPNLVFIPVGGSSTDSRFIVSSVTAVSSTQINATVQIGNTTNPVPAGDYRIELRDSVILPQVTTQRTDVTGVNMFRVTGGTGSTTPSTASSQAQAERLLGSWSFVYAIVTESTALYRFTRVEESSTVRGRYQAVDANFGAIGYYDEQERKFIVVDRSAALIDVMFKFDFTGDNTISGCYYQSDKGFLNQREYCTLTGTRTAQPSGTTGTTPTTTTSTTSADVVGTWRIYSSRLFYDQGGGGSVSSGGNTLTLRPDGTWSYGSSSGTWSVAAISSADWTRWNATPYGPARKLVVSGWNNSTADGPIEESSRVDFLWVLYRVSSPNPGTVYLKFGR